MSGHWSPEYDQIPPRVLDAINEYVRTGRPGGDFVMGCMNNNLGKAVCHADQDSMRNLRVIVLYLYNMIPSSCWGSEEKVKAWIEKKRKEREDDRGNTSS